MKPFEIQFEVSPDGEVVTYRIPGEVPGEVHDQLETALQDLQKLLGRVIDRRSLRPGHQRGNRIHPHGHQHLGGHRPH